MRFAAIVGQKKLKEQFIAMAADERVGHALLLYEESGFGALPMAIAFAQYLCCPNKADGDSCGSCPTCNKFQKLIHPDLHFAMPVNSTKTISADKKPVSDTFAAAWREAIISDPYLTEQQWYEKIGIENKSGIIGVNEAALIGRKMSMRSFEGGKKFMIIWLPERMNQEAANKLLKLIEEPPPDTFIFLVSESPENVIVTVLSRCQIFRLPPIESESLSMELVEEFDTDIEQARFWTKISGGSLSKARRLIKDSESSSIYDVYLATLLEGCANKDLKKVISFWEEISLKGRESQRQFCEYALEFLRRSLMTNIGSANISNTPDSAKEYITYWAAKIKPGFYPKAYEAINKALEDIDRNVNSRYIFADLGNRFFLSL
ncbi:MAG TPA: hypothetical protein DEO54_09615 [Rikenellaceae bacterium]|nr:MAG: hypothetical protein A2X20_08750 [Bacteroidetes bacterium GWE2_40_15]HBZ26471.1 hypothetical protein [Rikenellaceae bacterium]